VNPHKWLFTPIDLSVFYTSRPEILRRAFSLVPEYLKTGEDTRAVNYMDYGVQLGRRFRALKAWVIFRSFGREGISTRLRECVRLANVLADWIKSDNHFELAAPVSMGVVCFRFVGGDESKIDHLNSEIVEKINARGRAYLTQTKLRDRTVMRIGLGNVLTTEEHLRRAWGMIHETANELNREK
jgi:aromatic-L-amino-acid decarboxylase